MIVKDIDVHKSTFTTIKRFEIAQMRNSEVSYCDNEQNNTK